MFQSRRTASGMSARQAASACSLSSASEMRNDSPSRMRGATLRMTAESSTTRQCFIGKTPERLCSCGAGLGAESQVRVDVEDRQQPVLEAVHAAREPDPALVQMHRARLVARRGEVHYLPHLVDAEAV